MFIEIEVDTERCRESLGFMLNAMEDMTWGWYNTYPVIQYIVARNFYAQGRPRWPRRKGQSKYTGPLRASGALFDAATNPSMDPHFDHVVFSADVGIGGRVHHYGFEGTVSVPEHERTITEAFGRRLSRSVKHKVGAHKMNMKIEPRPFFGVPYGYGEETKIRAAIYRWVFLGGSNVFDRLEKGGF